MGAKMSQSRSWDAVLNIQARECLAEEPEHLAQIVELWLGKQSSSF